MPKDADEGASDEQLANTSRVAQQRGARACTVCRNAKMKCVGAENGQKACQRCERSGVQCVFEKHRRGRKPGSKLSEASKMLRKLEKGLHNAKRSHTNNLSLDILNNDEMKPNGDMDNQTLRSATSRGSAARASSLGAPKSAADTDDPEAEDDPDQIFPATMIRKERGHNSFFRTILNPENPAPSSSQDPGYRSPQTFAGDDNMVDPISAGLIDEAQAAVLFEAIFIRLNPFINLFDPVLHTVDYVRSRCPFLFTTLIMAGCKFFQPDLYKQCQRMAREYAVRAFAEGWNRVEVVQAFACLTYWKEPEDEFTWTYIGYACRMAVGLGLNKYTAIPPPRETPMQFRERRNRERTYLVMFVHDRSLSTQTGKSWMLPDDELVRHSSTWHEHNDGAQYRPEDVICAAFVQLRQIAAETTDCFHASAITGLSSSHDVNYDVVLHNCNNKLTEWQAHWGKEMERAGGERFHTSFVSIFRLYVRLFLNSFGTQGSSNVSTSVRALAMCYSSAIDCLKVVYNDFAPMSMLRYGQDTVTIMSAYAAVFLVQLLRTSPHLYELHAGAMAEIQEVISKTVNAYEDAAMVASTPSTASHARFLHGLLMSDVFKTPTRMYKTVQYNPSVGTQQPSPSKRTRSSLNSVTLNAAFEDSTQGHTAGFVSPGSSSQPVYNQPPPQQHQVHSYPQQPSTSPDVAMQTTYSNYPNSQEYSNEYESNPQQMAQNQATAAYPPPFPQHGTASDAQYWRYMFKSLGYGAGLEQPPTHGGLVGLANYSNVRQHDQYQSHYGNP